MASGLSGQVVLYRNRTTTLPNDPNDPADAPPVAAYGFQTHGRTLVAPDSSYGGNPDYFIEMAVPWSDLELVGILPTTRVLVWAGSSTTDDSLNGDLACHGAGAATLSGLASDPTVPDPNVDSDGDGVPDAVEVAAGTNPNDPNSRPAGYVSALVYQGGGGCQIGARGTPVAGLVTLLLVLVVSSGATRCSCTASLGRSRRCFRRRSPNRSSCSDRCNCPRRLPRARADHSRVGSTSHDSSAASSRFSS
jgi:hypothetical protein